jgi:hypothetical protein
MRENKYKMIFERKKLLVESSDPGRSKRMLPNLPNEVSRREFLKNGARTILFGGFVFMSVLLGKRKFSGSDQTSCQIELPCRNCSRIPGCENPKAVEFRSELDPTR